jgi:V/A-type H+-transporting ATPase subunit I
MVVFTVLLLAVGPSLVFLLGLVGAFVHPLRLTFVEFYQTLQFTGGGTEYRPLKRNE